MRKMGFRCYFYWAGQMAKSSWAQSMYTATRSSDNLWLNRVESSFERTHEFNSLSCLYAGTLQSFLVLTFSTFCSQTFKKCCSEWCIVKPWNSRLDFLALPLGKLAFQNCFEHSAFLLLLESLWIACKTHHWISLPNHHRLSDLLITSLAYCMAISFLELSDVQDVGALLRAL